MTDPPEPQLPPARWRDRRHRGLFWLAMLLAAALAAGGGAYAYSGYRDAQGADGAVRGYLQALARGDAADALAYGTVPRGAHPFLTSTVLKRQLQIAPMRNITVGLVATTADGARVPYSYTLAFARGNLPVNGTAVVTKVHDRWTLADVAASVQISLAGAQDRASLAGAAIPTGVTLLFPGAMPIEFDTPYLQLTEATEAVNLDQPASDNVEPELSAAGKAVVTQQLASMLTACGKGGPSTTARCPVPSPEFVPGSMSGTLRNIPANLSLEIDPSSAGLLTISGLATFAGTYRELDFNDVPHVRSGSVSVPFTASGYAVKPLTIAFTVPTQ